VLVVIGGNGSQAGELALQQCGSAVIGVAIAVVAEGAMYNADALLLYF
jgi:6-phosphofructokinase